MWATAFGAGRSLVAAFGELQQAARSLSRRHFQEDSSFLSAFPACLPVMLKRKFSRLFSCEYQ